MPMDNDAVWRNELDCGDYLSFNLVGDSLFQIDDPSCAVLSPDWVHDLAVRLLFLRVANTRVDCATLSVAGAYFIEQESEDSKWEKIRWLMAYYAAMALSNGKLTEEMVADFARLMFCGLPSVPVPDLAMAIKHTCMAPAYIVNANAQKVIAEKDEKADAINPDQINKLAMKDVLLYEELSACISLWQRVPEDMVTRRYVDYWRQAMAQEQE